MSIRKISLVNDQYYHIYTRSIAKYQIFNDDDDYKRILELIDMYRYSEFNYRYSQFKKLEVLTQKTILKALKKENNVLVEIVAHYSMPTHIHLILKQVSDDGISKYIGKVLNSYAKYFNTKHHRNGPLYESRFKNVLINSDEQLLHTTRYIHLNASSAGLVDNPFDWQYSSLKEYCEDIEDGICEFHQVIDMPPKKYKKFVLDQKSYQRSLSIIKNILIDNYTG